MTSKAALLNLLREKGDEQLDHIIQFADHKPKIYKKMLHKQNQETLKKTESVVKKQIEVPKSVEYKTEHKHNKHKKKK